MGGIVSPCLIVVKAQGIRYNLAMSLDENWGLIGHEWAVNLLRGHLANGRLRHAYLLTGPQGVGRRTLALRVAQGLNCPQPAAPGIPCGSCHTCQRIERMQHPDLMVIQAEEGSTTLKVDQIRTLQSGLALAPYEATYKIALLLRFEEANPNAANALLKTLEEPPRQVILFVTAQDTEALLPTIVSRCETLRLRPLALETVSDGLQQKWGLPPEQARLLAHISTGRPGYALHLHQNPDALENRQNYLDDHQRLLAASRVERFQYAEQLTKDKNTLKETLTIWMSLWRDILLSISGASTPLTNIDHVSEIQRIAEKIALETAQSMLQTFIQTFERLDHNTNTRLTVEVFMLDLPKIS